MDQLVCSELGHVFLKRRDRWADVRAGNQRESLGL